MSVLIVDDSKPFLLAVRAILGAAGFEDVVGFNSPRKALEYLRCHQDEDGQGDVDVILMDLIMPEMDGIEAVRVIKASRKLRHIPILMVSGQNDDRSIEQAFEAGAVDYISKPPKKLELRARVGAALRLKQEMDRRRAQQRQLQVLNRELEAANRELKRLSRVDPLTRLANRRSFDELLQREWQRAQRDRSVVSVVMVDIDFFKAFNDNHGHVAGDDCLQRVAGALNEALNRGGDIVARYGGEEFVVVLPDTDQVGARNVAEAMRRAVVELGIPHQRSTVADCVTVTVGVCTTLPCRTTTPAVAIQAADAALYRAKTAGRNRVGVAQDPAESSRVGSDPGWREPLPVDAASGGSH
jgi:diguanylate cyclase (GGDEF)-like protein